MDPCNDSLSFATSYIDTTGRNVSTTNIFFWELDNSAVIIERSRTCHSGWFEAENVKPRHSGSLDTEDCDNLIEECIYYNEVCNIIDNSGRKNNQLTIRENQKGQEITEDKSAKDNFLLLVVGLNDTSLEMKCLLVKGQFSMRARKVKVQKF